MSSLKTAKFEDEEARTGLSSSKSAQNKDEGVVSHESVEKFPKKFTFLNVSLGKAPYLRSKPGTVSGR